MSSESVLYEWPVGGYRPVPPPTQCMKCGKSATGMFSWLDHLRRLEDFAACDRCAKLKRVELEAARVKFRTGRYPSKEEG